MQWGTLQEAAGVYYYSCSCQHSAATSFLSLGDCEGSEEMTIIIAAVDFARVSHGIRIFSLGK